MILSSHLNNLRSLLRLHTDDTKFTDQRLGELLVSARNTIYEQKIDKQHEITRFSYKQICVPLTKSKFHDCSCVPDSVGCMVLKSDQDIPKPLINRNSMQMKAYNVNGDEIAYLKFNKRRRSKYHPVFDKETNLTQDIVNDKLVLFGSLLPKVIILEAIWSNPFELAVLPTCNTDGNIIGTPCYNILTDEFPLEEQYNIPVYQLVMELLGYTRKLPDDNIENAREDS